MPIDIRDKIYNEGAKKLLQVYSRKLANYNRSPSRLLGQYNRQHKSLGFYNGVR